MNRVLKFWIVVGSILAVLGVGIAFGVSNDDCGYTGDGFGDTNVCQENIYHRLGVLVQEQNQTNNLLAKLYCSESDNYISQGYTQCMNKVLGETK